MANHWSYHFCASSSVSLIVVMVVCTCLSSITGSCDGEFWMARNTFTLATVVSRFWMSNIEVQLQVKESYSHEQLRARIEYEIGRVPAKNKKQKTTYYDLNQKVMITLESSAGNRYFCTALGVQEPEFIDLHKSELHITFGLYMFERLLIIDQESYNWQHILGPARLLIWIEQNFDKFQRSDTTIPSNGIPVESFSYNTSEQEGLRVGEPFHMYLEYRAGESRDNIRIPSKVVISALQSTRGFTYEYSLESLQKHPAQASVNVHEANGGDTIEDEFTFPINYGCSQGMKKEVRIFESDERLDRVSFRASVRSIFEDPRQDTKAISKDQVVSYYKPLDSIRIESTQKDAIKSIELINFKTQRHFHIRLEREAATNLGSVDLDHQSKSCIATQPTPMISSNSDKDVEEFLLGPNEYALMGRGIVRGIDVLIYETTGGEPPYWIDRATSCIDRHNQKYVQSSDEKVNIVIYVANTAHQDRRYLVQMDLYRGRPIYRNGPIYRSIQFYDFVWSFNDRVADDLFSLHDHCIATAGSEVDGVEGEDVAQSVFVVDKVDQVNMLLGSVGDGQQQGSFEWLRNAMKRNLALRVAMQNDLDLPATSVTDLQSKLVVQQRSDSDAASIHVSFRQLRQSRPMVLRPMFLGTITVKAVNEDGSILIGDSFSFQECLFESGHRELLRHSNSLQFNYDSSTGRCWIRHAPLSTDIIGSSNRIDVLSLEFVEVKDSHPVAWSHGTERLKSLDKKFKLINENNSRDISLFQLRDVHAEKDTDFRAINSDFQVDVDSFRGFGLTQEGSRNWQIRPQDISINGNAISLTISPATCKQACLQDSRCQSYSLCIDQRGELACTLSEASFRSRRVVEQLTVSSARRNRNYGSLTVYLDPIDTIVLTRSLRCELHNKLYSQLFERTQKVMTKSIGRRLYGVDSREDCARLCLNQTNKVLSETDYDKRSDLSLRKLAQKRRDICAHFYYIDRINFESLSAAIKDQFRARLETPEAKPDDYEGDNGYCMVEASSLQATIAANSSSASEALFEYFVFDFETLFDKSHGISLKAATFNQEQLDSYNLLTQSGLYTDKMLRDPKKLEAYKGAIKSMESFIEQGNNIQSSALRIAHIRRCAKKCIFAEAGLVWPICKSFDIKVERDPESGDNQLVCYLNSMTLSETKIAERFDLIDTNRDQAREIWHYEPLLTTLRLMTGSQRDEFDANEVVLDDELDFLTLLQQHDSASVFGRILLLAIGIISGLVLGMKSANYCRDKYSQGPEDRIQFASRRATVEFVNQVNSEGKIPT